MADELYANTALKISRNSISNILRGILTLPILFFIIPYMTNKLGISIYGIWILITTFISFAGLADVGIGASITKYVSEYHIKRDYDGLNKLVNTATVLYLFLGMIIVLLFILLTGQILTIFFNTQLHSILWKELKIIFIGSLFIFFVNFVFSGYTSILGGLQRYDIVNAINLIAAFLNACGIFFFLSLGWGIRGLLLNNAIIMFLTVTATILAVKKNLPQVRFSPFIFSINKVRTILGYGIQVFTSSIASLVHFQMDKALIAYFLNTGLVGCYQIAAELVTHMRSIPLMIIAPIMPTASELRTIDDEKRLKELYFRSQKYNVLVALPIFVGAFVLAKAFVYLWLGPGYDMTTLALRFLIIAYFANILTGPGFLILTGIGKPQYGMYSSIFATISNLILSILFIIMYGYIGVLWGTAISMVLAAGYFKYMFHKITRIPFFDTARKMFIYPGCAATVSALGAYLLLQIRRDSISASYIFVLGLFFIIFYVLLIIILKQIDEFDKRLLSRFIPI